MIVNLFGPCDMSPVRFAALSPVDRTICVRLMFEAMAALPASTGLSGEALRAIGAERHARKAVDFDFAGAGALTAQDDLALGMALMAAIADEGGRIAVSAADLAARMGEGVSRARYALERLERQGMITTLRAGRGKKPSVLALTARGHEALAGRADRAGHDGERECAR